MEDTPANCSIWSFLGSSFELQQTILESLNAEWMLHDIKELLIFRCNHDIAVFKKIEFLAFRKHTDIFVNDTKKSLLNIFLIKKV